MKHTRYLPVLILFLFAHSARSQTVNYIRSWEPSRPLTDPALVTASTSVTEVRQTTRYFDGLGRPLQTVARQLSPSQKDLITPFVYDAFGRETIQYLPYAITGNGGYRAGALTEQNTFLGAQYPGENYFYAQTEPEASPLNRPVKNYAPGTSWAKAAGNRPTEIRYLVNTAADAVVIWNLPATGNIPTAAGTYAAGELYKTVTQDEQGKAVVEFKDKEGQVILKKVQLAATVTDGYSGWLCTCYVYDDLGNLRCVLPPKATEAALAAAWVISPDIAGHLCFQYSYDGRRRMITKKVPGAELTEMVYDLRDRLVFSRDGNLRSAGQWLVTCYDALNRPVMTALYTSSATRTALESAMATATGSGTITIPLPGVTDLVVASHDGRTLYKAQTSVTFGEGFETGTGTETETVLEPGFTQSTQQIAATHPLPGISAGELYPLTCTYYDTYSFDGARAYDGSYAAYLDAGTNPYPETPLVTTATQGMVTGSRVRVQGTNTWITTTTRYDDKGRVLQTLTENQTGGLDVVTRQYDFSGKLLSDYRHHRNLQAADAAGSEVRLLTANAYDPAGRLTGIRKKLNNAPAARVIVAHEYDELGQLKTKTLGNNLETMDYAYNVRGWLLGANRDYLAAAPSTHFFGFELGYDKATATAPGTTCTPLYNGNIAAITWRGAGGTAAPQRKYDFAYDNANRLLKADFLQNEHAGWSNATVNYNVKMGDGTDPNSAYDANGNIKRMQQWGLKGIGSAQIDDLTYSYTKTGQPFSNQLQQVTDGFNDPASMLGDFKDLNPAATVDYAYDANGNLTQDENKQITSITYNHLNLPEQITITGKGTIRYRYDAAGNKLQKTVEDLTTSPARTTVTDYLGGLVYENNQLQLIAHEEGRIRADYSRTPAQPVQMIYDYFLKDHLGNVRTVLTEGSGQNRYYMATMETNRAATENALFSNIDASRAPKPAGYPVDATTSPNDYVAKLNGSDPDKKIGPSIVLRVMAGDTIRIGAKAFYTSTGTAVSGSTVSDMVAALLRAFSTGGGPGGGAHGNGYGAGSPVATNFGNTGYQYLRDKDPSQNLSDKPKAYLNFALFDDQFTLVEEGSGVRQVQGAPDQLQTLATGLLPIPKTGFLYVYTSNESVEDVFFDNLTVNHLPGPLLEETHYYPFGLTMEGISSKAAGSLENKYKYNGIEKIGDLGLEDYDAQFRELDPQIGRWWQVDPRIENMEAWSPYASNFDNPISFSDFLGDAPEGMESTDDGGLTFRKVAASVLGTLNGVVKSMGFKGTKGEYMPWTDAELEYFNAAEMIGSYGGPLLPLAGRRIGPPESLVPVPEGSGKVIPVTQPVPLIAPLSEPQTTREAKGAQNSKTKDAAQAGKEAHKEFGEKAKAKGWKTEVTMTDPATGKKVRADAVTSGGHPVELKPNTPSGRAKGAKQLPQYERATGKNGRVIYYEPAKKLTQ